MDDARSMALTLIIQLVLWPLLALGTLARGWRRGGDRGDRATYAALALAYATFGAIVGRWDVVSTTLRPALLGATALGAVALVTGPPPSVAVRIRGRPFWARVLVACSLVGVVLAIRLPGPPPDALPLAFPFAEGRYAVVQGGASWLLNYHRVNRAQRFALDITKLGAAGRRADGLLPTDPSGYFVFGTAVVAPCAGRVRYALDGVPLSAIPSGDVRPPTGNYVALDCANTDATVLLAHLQTGSLQVHGGESVVAGQTLARAGQTGHTSEPHLHIHAARFTDDKGLGGAGIPLTFNGRFLVKNDVFEASITRP
jgi:hypothetical protein